MSLTIAITGGRNYRLQPDDWLWLGSQCGKLLKANPAAKAKDFCFIHGAAPGVDTEVATLLETYGFIVEPIPADWDRLGKAAGPIRNSILAQRCQEVWAFPGGRGTEDMLEKCRRLGVTVHESCTRTGNKFVLHPL